MKIVVTGSEGLIGRAVCEYLTRNTHEVERLDLALGHDLSDEKFVRQWFSASKAEALVNLFALNDHVDGKRASSRLFDISLASFNRYLEINVTSLFSVCREFARGERCGAIVNFTSTYGIVSPPTDLYGGDEKHIAYGVSKAAVVQLTRHLATHLAPHIRANCIAPGGVRLNQSAEFVEAYSRKAPMGRMMAVGELPPLVEYLATEKSSYATGGVFNYDGGWTAY
jgi:NAD(P)-dependent dehydrogenase (short-subunit alcohol dehydrogenase family)